MIGKHIPKRLQKINNKFSKSNFYSIDDLDNINLLRYDLFAIRFFKFDRSSMISNCWNSEPIMPKFSIIEFFLAQRCINFCTWNYCRSNVQPHRCRVCFQVFLAPINESLDSNKSFCNYHVVKNWNFFLHIWKKF